MHWNWQNLNERRTGQDGKTPLGLPWYGRAWMHFANRVALRFEWHLRSWSCGISAEVDQELKLHFALPPFSFWFTIEAPIFSRKYGKGRELRVSIHDWSLWWNFWTDNMGWSSKTPRYRNGAFHLIDFLFGRTRYEERPLACEWIEVPMPERTYYGAAQLQEATWRRARWFPRRLTRAELKMLPGEQVPHPGKGENSWDCGEDEIFSMTTPADSIEDGIARLVGSVLRSRRRHGGRGWRPQSARDGG